MASFHGVVGKILNGGGKQKEDKTQVETLMICLLKSSQDMPNVRTSVLVAKGERLQRKRKAFMWLREEFLDDVLFAVDVPPLTNVDVRKLLRILNKSGNESMECDAAESPSSLHFRINYDVFVLPGNTLSSISEDTHSQFLAQIRSVKVREDTRARVARAEDFCKENKLEFFKNAEC